MMTGNLFSCLKCYGSKKIFDEPNNLKEFEVQGNRVLQFASTVSVCFTMIGFGAFSSWTSPALPHLTSEKSEFPVSEIDGSWISSIFSIGGIVGCWIAPPLLDRLGRKLTLLLLALPHMISWIMLVLAKHVSVLYVSRLIGSITYIAANGVLLAYIGEIANKKFRGTLLTYCNVSFDLGVLFVVTIGAFLSYNSMNLVMLSTPVIFVSTFSLMPESPYFYLIRGQDEKARESLIKLRGRNNLDRISFELEKIKETIAEGKKWKGSTLKDVFFNKINRKAMLIVVVAFFAKHYSGYLTILAYTQDILSYSGFSLEPKYSTIVMACIKVFSGLAGVKIVDYVGRRILMLWTGILAAIFLGIVALFFFLKFYIKIENLSSISWLPLFALVCYQVVCSFGIASIPNVLMGELFSPEIKGLAMCCAFVIIDIYTFPVTFGFQPLNKAVGVYTTFWIFAICCFVGTILVYRITPETKGKTLEKIQELLS